MIFNLAPNLVPKFDCVWSVLLWSCVHNYIFPEIVSYLMRRIWKNSLSHLTIILIMIFLTFFRFTIDVRDCRPAIRVSYRESVSAAKFILWVFVTLIFNLDTPLVEIKFSQEHRFVCGTPLQVNVQYTNVPIQTAHDDDRTAVCNISLKLETGDGNTITRKLCVKREGRVQLNFGAWLFNLVNSNFFVNQGQRG